MPTIVAICPYCREGGVRAPDTSVGAAATCPKCKSSFTVVPSDDKLPGWAKVPDFSPPPKPTARKEPAPPTSPVDETRADARSPDRTEPSPVLPGEPKPKSKAKHQPDAAPTPAPDPTAAPDAAPTSAVRAVAHDLGLVFGLAALILVGPAMLVSQVPYGRVIGLVLAAVGFVAGLLSLGGEGRAKLAGGVAMGAHVLVAVFLLFLPSWLGLEEWGGPPPEEVKGPVAVEHGTGVPLSAGPTDWIDAARSSWEYKDTRVTLRSALGPVVLTGPKDAKRTTKEPYLQLVVQVANVGAAREIPLSGWAAGQGVESVRVTDSAGKTLLPATFDGGFAPAERGRPVPRALPGHASEVALVYTAPTPRSEYVRVQLPGAAVGAADDIRFRIGTLGFLPRVPGK
jgi:hypothetical protein